MAADVLPGNAGVHAGGHGPAAGRAGFSPAPAAGLDISFRAPARRLPDVLEIGLRGKRPRVEAYRDGCLIAL